MPSDSSTGTRDFAPADPISPASDFARHFAAGGKPASAWAVGAEAELIGFTRATLSRIDPDQVQAVLLEFSAETVARQVERGYVTEAALATGGRITLEPGGQVEFSGEPRASLADVESSLRRFTSRLAEIGEEKGIIFVACGFDPVRSIEEQQWIPKRRYEIMRPYLIKRGRRAWDMMCRTAAVQVNLDYSDLADLARKFTLANRLGPIAAAIFANSPFEQARLSGFKSTRYAAWLETDSDRTGLPVALESDFSIDRLISQVAAVPMLFIRRDGNYIDYTGHSFTEFLAGCGCPERPLFQDFSDHLSTIFTEARLKPHIEQRSMDCNSTEMMMAALAFWKGLMYGGGSLDAALAIVPRLDAGEFRRLQLEVARLGLEAKTESVTVIDLARAAVELAREGLRATAPDEARYLDPLDELVLRERVSPADILIRNFEGAWRGSIVKAVDYLRVLAK